MTEIIIHIIYIVGFYGFVIAFICLWGFVLPETIQEYGISGRFTSLIGISILILLTITALICTMVAMIFHDPSVSFLLNKIS